MKNEFLQKVVQGKVTIPQRVREFLKIMDGDFVMVTIVKEPKDGDYSEKTEEDKKN